MVPGKHREAMSLHCRADDYLYNYTPNRITRQMKHRLLTLCLIAIIALATADTFGQGKITRPAKKPTQQSTKPREKPTKPQQHQGGGGQDNRPTNTNPLAPRTLSAPIETFTVNGVSFDMVRVDGGTYSMGSNTGDSREKPVHTESVSTFYIGKTEVTQQLWVAVMGFNPSYFRGETLPVETVSWYDCQEFVERLSRLTGRNFRLPTEAEWEYAARGGNRSRGYKYSGSDDAYRVAWTNENSDCRTHPVAQKLDNELGIFDMTGNVWEWCSDYWSSSYSSPRNSSDRVIRGGGLNNSPSICRVALRNSGAPARGSDANGLRLAL